MTLWFAQVFGDGGAVELARVCAADGKLDFVAAQGELLAWRLGCGLAAELPAIGKGFGNDEGIVGFP